MVHQVTLSICTLTRPFILVYWVLFISYFLRQFITANAPFTLDKGATTMSCKEQIFTYSQVVSVLPSSFVISPLCSQPCLQALQGFSKFENTRSHTAEVFHHSSLVVLPSSWQRQRRTFAVKPPGRMSG